MSQGRGLEQASGLVRRRLIIRLIGALFLLIAASMIPSLLLSLYYGEQDRGAFIATLLIIVPIGAACVRFGRNARDDIARREGLFLVALAWLICIVVGAMPFSFFAHRTTMGLSDHGAVASYAAPGARAVHGSCKSAGRGAPGGEFCAISNALFESASGFTTTGSTVLGRGLWETPERKRAEELPHGLLFWRNMTQWLGGMGIIVLAVALLPLLGIGGMQLFRAEVPGPTAAKLVPRVGETARVLWSVYGLMTVVLALAMMAGGVRPYLAFAHAMSTVSTGGFSPLAASVGGLNSPFSEWVIVLFMIACGANFALHHRSVERRRAVYWSDREFRTFAVMTGVSALAIFASLVSVGGETPMLDSLRQAVFTVASIATTTGFASVDYTPWLATMPVVVLILTGIGTLGGCAGSTSGGVKVIRLALGLRLAAREFYRLIHPRGVRTVRFAGQRVDYSVIDGVASFLVLFFVLAAVGALWLAAEGFSPLEAMSASLTCLANVGPGVGTFGPAGNFNEVSAAGKGMLATLMVLGRLEILTVLVLLTPDYWR